MAGLKQRTQALSNTCATSYPAERIASVAPHIPLGAVLLDGDGMLHVVEPDEHLVRTVNGHLVCVRPAHEGMACQVELAA